MGRTLLFLTSLLLLIPSAQAQDFGKVQGLVSAASGPLAGAQCKLLSQSKTTGSDGRFLFEKVPVGEQRIKCSKAGFQTQSKSVTVKGGQSVKINFKLAARVAPVVADEAEESKAEAPRAKLAPPIKRADSRSRGHRAGKKVKARMKRPSMRKPRRSRSAPMAMNIASAPPPSRPMIAKEMSPKPASREGYDKIKENEFKSALKEPLSTFSIDVDTAAYANVRRFLNMSRLPPADAVRIEELLNYFNYDYPAPKEQPFSVNTEISQAPWSPAHRLVHIGLQGKKVDFQALPPSNLTFLLDVSGSMGSPNKLPLLKAALKLLVRNMRAQDRVAIVVYAGAAGLVLPSTPGKQREKIIAALSGLRSGGSTAGGAGIKLAYKVAQDNFIKGGNNRIILATDGDFNVGQSSDGELVRLIEQKRKSGVFLTILGFGMGNYQDAKMQKLAKHGNGNHAYIDSILEAKKVLVKEMGGTLFTIAKDVKIQIEFNPTRVKAYRLIGYENRMLAAKDFNDDKKDAGELGAGHTVTALYEIVPAGSKEQIPGIDELKYQKSALSPAAGSQELMTLKLRYKAPDGDKSKLISQPILDQQIKETSDNFRFSAAVTMFGMLLRDSKFKGQSSWKLIKDLGRGAKGKDQEGYRHDFIQLVKKAELLKQIK